MSSIAGCGFPALTVPTMGRDTVIPALPVTTMLRELPARREICPLRSSASRWRKAVTVPDVPICSDISLWVGGYPCWSMQAMM